MDRSDQWKEAARNHIFIDFYGALKPAGLEYRYPNILTYEGVRGIEYNGGCEPGNTI